MHNISLCDDGRSRSTPGVPGVRWQLNYHYLYGILIGVDIISYGH